jgi:formate dehydrogenase major subunit
MILITGRQLEHWHTGSMTRRAEVLDALEPVAVVYVCQQDMEKSGLEAGGEITVKSRRGELTAFVRLDPALKPGEVFIPFCFHEAAANMLTNEALDPFGKIPEFKFCAVKILAV